MSEQYERIAARNRAAASLLAWANGGREPSPAAVQTLLDMVDDGNRAEARGVREDPGDRRPKLSLLTRTAVLEPEPPATLAIERLHIAEKAKSVLGYRFLAENFQSNAIDTANKRDAARAFQRLGFDPLDANKVKFYQLRMEEFLLHQQYWTNVRLEDYRQPVPEFALLRAIDLKELLPAARFEIECLRYVGRDTRDPYPDPFLVLIYAGERYYIDVWDEPMFEGRRTV